MNAHSSGLKQDHEGLYMLDPNGKRAAVTEHPSQRLVLVGHSYEAGRGVRKHWERDGKDIGMDGI